MIESLQKKSQETINNIVAANVPGSTTANVSVSTIADVPITATSDVFVSTVADVPAFTSTDVPISFVDVLVSADPDPNCLLTLAKKQKVNEVYDVLMKQSKKRKQVTQMASPKSSLLILKRVNLAMENHLIYMAIASMLSNLLSMWVY